MNPVDEKFKDFMNKSFNSQANLDNSTIWSDLEDNAVSDVHLICLCLQGNFEWKF